MGTLKDRIERREPNPNIVPLIERSAVRKPIWQQRMEAGKLPAKDMTGRAP